MADDLPPCDTLQRPDAVDSSGLPVALAESLPGLHAWLDALGSLSPANLDGRQAEAVATVLAAVISRASVAQARMLPVIEADGLWSITARSLPRYAARQLGVSLHTAQAQVKLGRALRDDLPATAVASATGEIGVEHARVLADLAPTTELRRVALANDPVCDEAWLVERARQMPVEQFRRCVNGWAKAVDPDADDRGYVQSCDRAYLDVSATLGGYHVEGFLTLDDGQTLRTAMGALARLGLDLQDIGKGRTVRPRVGVLVHLDTLHTWPTGPGHARRVASCRTRRRGSHLTRWRTVRSSRTAPRSRESC